MGGEGVGGMGLIEWRGVGKIIFSAGRREFGDVALLYIYSSPCLPNDLFFFLINKIA